MPLFFQASVYSVRYPHKFRIFLTLLYTFVENMWVRYRVLYMYITSSETKKGMQNINHHAGPVQQSMWLWAYGANNIGKVQLIQG